MKIQFLLESPHQVDIKNVVKSSKPFLGYYNTLETHSETLGNKLFSIENKLYCQHFPMCSGKKQPLSISIDHFEAITVSPPLFAPQ